MSTTPTVLVAALNEFNHSVQRFPSVTEYEVAREAYCSDMMDREEYVEDAITGNLLRIKDQTLHVSTAADIQDNMSIPDEWKVEDVRDLAVLMLKPSPHRAMGAHPAQPVLMRAGPGTGKTWMIKQAAFAIAEHLKPNLGTSGGIRLVPMVVYVQRIVFLIREGGTGGLLLLYIESVYSGKKSEMWRKMLMQAYEMRALIVLIDGVDEAAGLRDEIEFFIHQELVPSGNRVLVTSRPEGVNLPKYKERFVIMNLNALTNAQQRAAVSVQMQGSEFFDHLLSLGEVRKRLDDVYDKMKDSIQHDLEELFAPNRFLIEGKLADHEKAFDPAERQTVYVAVVQTSEEDLALAEAMVTFNSMRTQQPANLTLAPATDGESLQAASTEILSGVISASKPELATGQAGAAAVAGVADNDDVLKREVVYEYRLVQEIRAEPTSLTLTQLNRMLQAIGRGSEAANTSVLELIDAAVARVPLTAHRTDYEAEMNGALQPLTHLNPQARKVAIELGLMLRREAALVAPEKDRQRNKKRRSVVEVPSSSKAAAAWTRVMQRTDEVYLACEALFAPFRKSIEAVAWEQDNRSNRVVEVLTTLRCARNSTPTPIPAHASRSLAFSSTPIRAHSHLRPIVGATLQRSRAHRHKGR